MVVNIPAPRTQGVQWNFLGIPQSGNPVARPQGVLSLKTKHKNYGAPNKKPCARNPAHDTAIGKNLFPKDKDH